MNFNNVYVLKGGMVNFSKKYAKYLVKQGNTHAMNLGNYMRNLRINDDGLEEIDLIEESEEDEKEEEMEMYVKRDRLIEDLENEMMLKELALIKENNDEQKQKQKFEEKKQKFHQKIQKVKPRSSGVMTEEPNFFFKRDKKEIIQNLGIREGQELQRSLYLMKFPEKFTYPIQHEEEWLLGKRTPAFMKSMIFPPSEIPKHYSNDKFSQSLKLEYVYGTSRKGVTGKILYKNIANKLVYIAAGVGVIYDPIDNNQRHFVKHTDDIKAIAIHPNKKYFATGGCGFKNMIYIWDSLTLKVIQEIPSHKHFEESGVKSLCFSPDGKLIWAIGGQVPVVIVFIWAKTGRAQYGGMKKLSRFDTTGIFANPVTHQVKWLGKGSRFYEFIEEDQMVVGKNALVNTRGGKIQVFHDVIFDKQGRTYVGTKSGYVYVFNSKHLISTKKCHKSPVFALAVLPDNDRFASGSRKFVKIWKFLQIKKGGQKRKKRRPPRYRKKGKHVDFFTLLSTINVGYSIGSLVSLNNDELYGISRDDGAFFYINTQDKTSQRKIITNFHQSQEITSELWGLDIFPNNNKYFMTCCDDGKILLYSRAERKTIAGFCVKGKEFRGLSIHPSGLHFVVSTKLGQVLIYLLPPLFFKKKPVCLKELFQNRKNEEVKVVKYSPDGRYLAVASNDNAINVYSVKNYYSLICSMKGNCSTITQLDWSVDSKYVQTVSSSYELLYFNIRDKRLVLNPSTLRNMKWMTQSCILGWDVKGQWDMSIYNDGTDVNNCWVNFKKNLLVSVDDLSCVNLFKYPVVKKKPMKKTYRGHCSHVTNVRISHDGEYVYTTGGGDLTIFQWKILDRVVEDTQLPDGEVLVE